MFIAPLHRKGCSSIAVCMFVSAGMFMSWCSKNVIVYLPILQQWLYTVQHQHLGWNCRCLHNQTICNMGLLGGAHYADFLEEMLLLLENVPMHVYKSIWFQQDRWIRHEGTTASAPHAPNLTPIP
jgi:hypothetical protein